MLRPPPLSTFHRERLTFTLYTVNTPAAIPPRLTFLLFSRVRGLSRERGEGRISKNKRKTARTIVRLVDAGSRFIEAVAKLVDAISRWLV